MGYLASSPQDYQGHEKQGRTERNCPRAQEIGETCQLEAMWSPGLDPGMERDDNGKAGKIQIKAGVLLILFKAVTYLILLFHFFALKLISVIERFISTLFMNPIPFSFF